MKEGCGADLGLTWTLAVGTEGHTGKGAVPELAWISRGFSKPQPCAALSSDGEPQTGKGRPGGPCDAPRSALSRGTGKLDAGRRT